MILRYIYVQALGSLSFLMFVTGVLVTGLIAGVRSSFVTLCNGLNIHIVDKEE